MKKTPCRRHLLRLLSMLLSIALLIGMAPLVIPITAFTPSDHGVSFTAEEAYTMSSSVKAAPLTVEATVCLPSGYSGRGGVVVGNYGSWNECFGIEIHTSGKPRIYIKGDGGEVLTDVSFSSVNVATGKFVHFAITMDVANQTACCYVNGVLAQTLENVVYPTESFVTSPVYMVGGDYRGGNSQYFKGAISKLALYSDIRTADEIAADYASGAAVGDSAILCAYDLSNSGSVRLEDLSANGIDLICSNAVGGGDFEVDATYKTVRALGANPETLEAWVYVPANHQGRAGSVFGNYPTSPCLNFEIVTGGIPRLYFRNSSGVASDFRFSSIDIRGSWTHVALVHDSEGEQVLCYINGSLAGTITDGYADYDEALKNTVFAVGSDVQAGNGQFFKGRLRDVAVWSDARTADEIAASYQNGIARGAEGLIAHYDMSEEGVGRLKDLSGNGLHLAYSGTDPQYAAENIGRSFSADDHFVGTKALSATPETMSAWVYLPDGYSSRAGVLMGNFNFDTSFEFEIYYNGNPRLYYRDANGVGYSFVFNSVKVNVGKWTYVTVTHDVAAGELRCYVNGVLAQTLTADEGGKALGAYPDGMLTNPVSIGADRQASGAQHFKGRLAAASAYSDVRSAEEIMRDYQRGADANDASLLFQYDLTQSTAAILHDRSGNAYHLMNDKLGSSFNVETTYQTARTYATAPETLEAWVYLPAGYSARPGCVFGNYSASSCINFEIYYNGQARLYYRGSASGTVSLVFDQVDIRGAWAHVALVHDAASGKAHCYINGELVQTIASGVNAYDPGVISTEFGFGGDRQGGNLQYYKGRMSGLTLYSDVRTAEEIKADYLYGANKADAALLADYRVMSELNYADVPDASGNGYDMICTFDNIWVGADKGKYDGEYDYSLALIGDTQSLSYRYNKSEYASSLPNLYQWLVDNKDDKKIQYVLGLGDITETDSAAEWEYAKAAITKLDGNLPYSLVWGMNHDSPGQLNAYFAEHTAFTDNISGYYVEGDVANAYYNFEVGTTKYMILALDFGAKDDVLAWASDVIAANPDRRVIITTHGYLNYDGTTLDPSEDYAPSANYYDPENNDGDDIWEKLASQHANICLVISGHICSDEVVISQQVGIHGNTVTQLLVDPQEIDGRYNGGTAMVAMLYFSNGGKDVAVEYYSTVRDAYLPLQSFSVETVAKIGDEEYTTLIEAVSAAVDGQTVVLLDDVVMPEQLIVPNAITLDLGENKLTVAGDEETYGLVVRDALTIRNGSLHIVGAYGIEVQSAAALTVESGSFTANGDNIYMIGNRGTTSILDGDFAGVCCVVKHFEGSLSIEGGSFSVDGYEGMLASADILGGDGISVTGGTFSKMLPLGSAADGYIIAVGHEDGLCTVIPNEYVDFLGGSLRYADAVDGMANIRFGYRFAENFDIESSAWCWSYGYADSENVYEAVGVNYSVDNISSLVIKNVPLSDYERTIRVRLCFNVEVDEVAYTVYDEWQTRSVLEVARAIVDSDTESAESIAYAESLIAAVEMQ